MSSERKADRRPARTVRRLLEAGRAELRVSSYNDLSLRAVAHRAGVSPASAYTYFPSKDALVATIYLDLLGDLRPHTDESESAWVRVSSTLRDMALLTSGERELTTAWATALTSVEESVLPIASEITRVIADRIRAALGPDRRPGLVVPLMMVMSGSLMAARFLSFEENARYLDNAVKLIVDRDESCDP